MKTKPISTTIVGLAIGVLGGYAIASFVRSDAPSTMVSETTTPSSALESRTRSGLKSELSELDAEGLGQKFDSIFTDDEPGKLFRCQLCIEAWLKLNLPAAIEAVMIKHEQGAEPDPLLALRAVGGPYWKQLVEYWDNGGSRYGKDLAAAISDICQEQSPTDSSRMELVSALAEEEGERIAKALAACASFAEAVEAVQNEGLALDEAAMSAIGKMFASDILTSGENFDQLEPETKSALIKAVIATAGPKNPVSTLDFASAHDKDFRGGYYSLAVETGMAADPGATEAWILKQRNDRLLPYHGITHALKYYTSRGETEAARDLISRYQSEFPGKVLSPDALAELAKQDPELFVPLLPSLDPKILSEYASEVIDEYAALNPEAASAMLESENLENRERWEQAVAKAKFGDDYKGLLTHYLENDVHEIVIAFMLSEMADADHTGAWDMIAKLEDPEIRGTAVGHLIPDMLAISPERAIDSVQELPEGAGRKYATQRLGEAFGNQDPLAGSELMLEWKEEGILNDGFIFHYVNAAGEIDWRGALPWAAEATNPFLRYLMAERFKRMDGVPDEEVERLIPKDTTQEHGQF